MERSIPAFLSSTGKYFESMGHIFGILQCAVCVHLGMGPNAKQSFKLFKITMVVFLELKKGLMGPYQHILLDKCHLRGVVEVKSSQTGPGQHLELDALRKAVLSHSLVNRNNCNVK